MPSTHPFQIAMSDMYAAWCDDQGLRPMSADELICEDLTDYQRSWVSQFILAWEATEDHPKFWSI
jgi:hypothetical protein